MLAGARRQLVTEQLREMVAQHAQRITAMTGQMFGGPYTDGLMRDGTVLLDSEPPTAAILAVETVTGRGMTCSLAFSTFTTSKEGVFSIGHRWARSLPTSGSTGRCSMRRSRLSWEARFRVISLIAGGC